MTFTKSKNIEIIQSMFSDHSRIQLEISNRSKFGDIHIVWKLNKWVKQEIQRK